MGEPHVPNPSITPGDEPPHEARVDHHVVAIAARRSVELAPTVISRSPAWSMSPYTRSVGNASFGYCSIASTTNRAVPPSVRSIATSSPGSRSRRWKNTPGAWFQSTCAATTAGPRSPGVGRAGEPSGDRAVRRDLQRPVGLQAQPDQRRVDPERRDADRTGSPPSGRGRTLRWAGVGGAGGSSPAATPEAGTHRARRHRTAAHGGRPAGVGEGRPPPRDRTAGGGGTVVEHRSAPGPAESGRPAGGRQGGPPRRPAGQQDDRRQSGPVGLTQRPTRRLSAPCGFTRIWCSGTVCTGAAPGPRVAGDDARPPVAVDDGLRGPPPGLAHRRPAAAGRAILK